MIKKNSLKNFHKRHSSGLAWVLVFGLFAVLVLLLPQSAQAEEKSGEKRGFLHGLHIGATYPLGSLNTYQDSNIHFRLNLGYAINNNLSIMAFIGFNQFTEDTEPFDLNYFWYNASLNLQVAVITTPTGVSYFFQGGPGLYVPKSHSNIPLTITLGFNLGFGCRIPIRTPFHMEWGAYYHYTNISKPGNPKYSFLAFHTGMIYIW
jgi:hypothetical protein